MIKKFKDYQQMDWRCTSGISTEIARNEDSSSKEVFDWRLAMEDVQGGVLPPFNGFNRIFSVLEGAAANVVINGQYENTLKTYELVRLEGGSATNVSPVGAVKDLCLLYNNELYTGAYQWCQVGSEPQTFNSMADTLLVFSAAPQITVTTGGSAQALSKYDTLITTGGGQDVTVSGATPADYACVIELLRH